jgi:hypothetical protein
MFLSESMADIGRLRTKQQMAEYGRKIINGIGNGAYISSLFFLLLLVR